jgi:type II secretory pathway predicted ATPase ExeA
MYLQFFALRDLPFELTSSPKYLFMTPQHREALSNLQYGLSAFKGVTVLIGEAGTGKTTLLRSALESEDCAHVRCLYINNPALTRDEFVETLARGLNLSVEARTSKATLLAELEPLLRQRRRAGESLALVIDEAHRLSDELLEEIRLLANIETDEEKLLPLVLAGQPELGDRLRTPALRQLHQRVALRCELAPFEQNDTLAYMASRIRTAGGQGANLFTREAACLIHQKSRGIPRLINVLCDNALVGAFAQNVRPVNSQLVREVCRDFDLDVADETVPTSPQVRMIEPRRDAADAAEAPAAAESQPAPRQADPLRDADAAGHQGGKWLAQRFRSFR